MEKGHKLYDEKRSLYLMKYGIIILRFWDNEVLNNISGVWEKIAAELEKFNPTC